MDKESKCKLCGKIEEKYLHISIIFDESRYSYIHPPDKRNIPFIEKMDYHIEDIIAISRHYDIALSSNRVIFSIGLLHHEQKLYFVTEDKRTYLYLSLEHPIE